MSDPLRPSVEVLMAIGSALVHADEFLGPNSHPVDLDAFRTAMGQENVQQWIKDMGPLLPVKR